jgi:hypothetical protein
VKPKFILLAVCSIAILLGLAFVPGPAARPTVAFFQCYTNASYEKVAVFVITNSSSKTFSYYGYGRTLPHFQVKVQTVSGWRTSSLRWCGVGAELQALRAHNSVQFEVHDVDTPFVVGLYFEPGTPDEITRRYLSRYAVFSRWFCRVTHFEGFQPPITWSQPVTLQN